MCITIIFSSTAAVLSPFSYPHVPLSEAPQHSITSGGATSAPKRPRVDPSSAPPLPGQ